MGEGRQDSTGPPPSEGYRHVSVQEAAEHLGTTVDAIRKRVQRGTIAYDKAPDGRVWILLDTDMPSHAETGQRHDTGRPQSEPDALTSELRDRLRYVEEQLEAEREAHAESRRLLLAALEKIPPAIEAPREARESPVSEARPGPGDSPTPAPEEAQEATEGTKTGSSPAGEERRPWWWRIFGG